MPDANITKKALANSMQKLMLEKSFDKISVIDICEGCGMNRKSFYYHFKDKYDLVNWIFYTDFIVLISSRNYENGWDLMQAVSHLFYENQDFYREALKIEGQNSFKDYFYESLTPIFTFLIANIGVAENVDINIRYVCDAYLAVMNRWLMEGCPQDPDAFMENFKKVILGLATLVSDDTSAD